MENNSAGECIETTRYDVDVDADADDASDDDDRGCRERHARMDFVFPFFLYFLSYSIHIRNTASHSIAIAHTSIVRVS